jgi:hypothetical protein
MCVRCIGKNDRNEQEDEKMRRSLSLSLSFSFSLVARKSNVSRRASFTLGIADPKEALRIDQSFFQLRGAFGALQSFRVIKRE